MSSISKKIKKLKTSLKWNITISHDGNRCEIDSDQTANHHNIILPDNDRSPREIEYLHELCHAKLCETVHPLFSGILFAQGYDPGVVSFLSPIFRSVNDWFVDDLLYQLAPDQCKAEIEEHYKLVLDQLKENNTGDIMTFASASFIFAQADKYLNVKTPVTGQLEKGIKCFLAINPSNPSLSKLDRLVNSMCNLFQYNAKIIDDSGVECWKVTEYKGGA